MLRSIFFTILISSSIFACTEQSEQEETLPILGEKTTQTRIENGEEVIDTLYHTVGDFNFIDQDSSRFTQADVAGKVYVADFFFTSCPSICIPMAKQMLRVHERFGQNPDFAIVSHSLDPGYDRPAVLKQYANGLGLSDSSNWHFLTTDENTTDVFDHGQSQYMVTARSDETVPGGVLHSGAFILVDRKGRIRGMYDGTDPNAVDKLMADIDLLLTKEPAAL